jgi:hypothetical protein
VAELQRQLIAAKDELCKAQQRISKLSMELFRVQCDLRRETDINKIALGYIPDDRIDDYWLELPQAQGLFLPLSSPPHSVSFLLLESCGFSTCAQPTRRV